MFAPLTPFPFSNHWALRLMLPISKARVIKNFISAVVFFKLRLFGLLILAYRSRELSFCKIQRKPPALVDGPQVASEVTAYCHHDHAEEGDNCPIDLVFRTQAILEEVVGQVGAERNANGAAKGAADYQQACHPALRKKIRGAHVTNLRTKAHSGLTPPWH